VRVVNETTYPTATLRKVLCAVHRNLAEYEGRLAHWKGLTVTVVYSTDTRSSGYAYYYGDVRLRLPRHPGYGQGERGRAWRKQLGGEAGVEAKFGRNRIEVTLLAALIHHELMHCYGYRHGQFSCPFHKGNAREREYGWMRGNIAPVDDDGHAYVYDTSPRATPKRDAAADRHERRLARLKAWRSKLKRAENAIAKLERQNREYDRRLGRAAAHKEVK